MGFGLQISSNLGSSQNIKALIFLVLVPTTICEAPSVSTTTIEITSQHPIGREGGIPYITPVGYSRTTAIMNEDSTQATERVPSRTTPPVEHTEILAMHGEPPVMEDMFQFFELPRIFGFVAGDEFETTKATASLSIRRSFDLRIPSARVKTTVNPTGLIPFMETHITKFDHAVSFNNIQAASKQGDYVKTTQLPTVSMIPHFGQPAHLIANDGFRVGTILHAQPTLQTTKTSVSQVQGSTSTPAYRIPEDLPENAVSHVTSMSTPENGLRHSKLSALLDSVLLNYDRRMRPRNDQLQFVTIITDFVPLSIIEFNTQEQSFSVMGYFKMDWRDDFLTWDPSTYDNTKTLRIPARSVWIPKLAVVKSNDGNGLVGDADTDIVLINYRGYVRWFPEGIYSFVCQVTIKFYPFDLQTCTLTYFIADEDNSTVSLKHDGEVDLSEYIENAQWKLVNLTAEIKRTDNMVNFIFTVERRGGFTMFTLILPVLMLSLLSGATFLIPIESGEKCSFSVSIFLAYGIFETIVIDTLPHNSLGVSYFIIYLTSMLIISTLLTFYTILQAKVFDIIGNKELRILRRCTRGDVISWGRFLQKLDTYIFILFLVVVVGFTSTFLGVMTEKFDFL